MLITNINQFDQWIDTVATTGNGDGESIFLYQELPQYEARIELRNGGKEIGFYFNDEYEIVEHSVSVLPDRKHGRLIRQNKDVKHLLKKFLCDLVIADVDGRDGDVNEPMDGDAVDAFAEKFGLTAVEKNFVNEFEGNV